MTRVLSATMVDDELCGRVLGEYVLRERLDEGGFGAVYRCEQPLLGRDVVVKVLHQRLRKRGAAAQRFIREAQLASRLDHPYAAHVYAFGIEDDGVLWIAMERVSGVTLATWLQQRGPMTLEELVPLVERLAEVVDAAHERGIVHRDIKPANIMVTERAGRLVPRLLDFGVAKPLDTPEPPATTDDPEDTTPRRRLRPGLTSTSITLGSPSYMAPEQWMSPESVGPAADVYALGVVVYEALTGGRPFRSESAEVLGAMHCESPVPSLGNGLDPVFAGALSKHPDARYRTATEFAAALRAELESRMAATVSAAARRWRDRGKPSGLLWRDGAYADLERWMQRTGLRAAGAIEIEFAEASAAAASESARRARWVRRGGYALAAAMVAIVVGVVQFRAIMEVQVSRRVAAETAIASEVEQGRAALLHDDLPEAAEHLRSAARRGDLSAPTAVMLAHAERPRSAERARLPSAGGRMWSATYSPDGTRIVTADDRAAQIWDAKTHRLLGTVPHDDTVYAAVFMPDGARVVTAGGDGRVRIARAEDGAPVREFTRPRRLGPVLRYYLVAVSPDAQRIAAVDMMGTVVDVWAADGALLAELAIGPDVGPGRGWPALAFSSDGRWLAATGGEDAHVFDVDLHPVAVLPGPGVRALAWSPTGDRLLTGATTGAAAIWSVPSGERAVRLRDVGDPVDAVAWSPRGSRAALSTRGGAVQVFSAAGALVSRGAALHGKVGALEFSPDGSRLLAAGAGVAVIDATAGLPLAVLEPAAAVLAAHFDPAGAHVAGALRDGVGKIWDAKSTYLQWRTPPSADDCGVATSAVPDGRFVAVGCGTRPVRVYDTSTGTMLAELPPSPQVLPVVSVDGRRAAIARGSAAEIYELPGGRLLRAEQHTAAVTALAMSSAGEMIAGDSAGGVGTSAPVDRAGVDAVAVLADGRIAVASGMRLRILGADGGELAVLATSFRIGFLRPSPDGTRLVTVPVASAAAPPELWDMRSLTRIAQLAGHVGRVFGARWDGERVLTMGLDETVRMWDGGSSLLRVFHAPGAVFDADLSPDGAWLIAGLGEGKIRVWDAATGRPVWATSAHTAAVIGVRWDGEAIVTRGFGGDLAKWTGIVRQ